MTVREAICGRLHALQPATESLLRHASVLGQLFDEETLCLLAGYTADEVSAALVEAQEAGLVEDAGSEGFRFAHPLMPEAIAAESHTPRRKLHRLAARALEHLLPRRGIAARLAFHYRESGLQEDLAKAVAYSIQAGDEAEGSHSHRDALPHYTQAVELARYLGHGEEEAEALIRRADVRYFTAAFDAAQDDLARAAHLFRTLRNWDRLTWATCQRAKVCDALQRTPETLLFLEELINVLAAQADMVHGSPWPPPEASLEERAIRATSVLSAMSATRLLLCLTSRMAILRRYDEVSSLSAATVTAAHRAASSRMESLAHSFHAMAQIEQGQHREALVTLRAARAAAETSCDIETLVLAHVVTGETYALQAETRAACQQWEQSLALTTQLHDVNTRGEVLINLGRGYLEVGDWASARRRFEEARSTEEWEESPWQVVAEVALRYLDAVQGQVVPAGPFDPDRVLATYGMTDADLPIFLQAALVELSVLLESYKTNPERLGALLSEQAGQQGREHLLITLAWAEVEAGQAVAAEAALQAARAQAQRRHNRAVEAHLWRVEAELALREGRLDDAQRLLEKALELSRALSHPYAEAKILDVVGHLYSALGTPALARECWQRALELLSAMGESAYARRIHAHTPQSPAHHENGASPNVSSPTVSS
jgi:tetratricopeptide (TPR) repeat protein